MSTKAYSYIVKLLSSRDYSENKLREKLQEKKFPANEIDDALNEIKGRGYLRENVYNEARIRGFMNKNYSPHYIKQKLNQEHLDVSIEQIEEVFYENQVSTQNQIELLIRKKMNGKTEQELKEQNKILRYLISKGHDFEESKRILKVINLEVQVLNN